MKALIALISLSIVIHAASAGEVVPENPKLLNSLKSLNATSVAPEKGERVARDWDAVILASPVISGYAGSKAAPEPSNEYDCIVSEYVTDTEKVITKQTASVWFAQIDSAKSAASMEEILTKILTPDSSKNAVFSPIEEGVGIARALTGSDSQVMSLLNSARSADEPDWRGSLRIIQDGATTYLWTLKLTGRPMAAVVGYDDALNKNWLERFR